MKNGAAQSNKGRPKPFLKWAGGKRSLVKEILPSLPDYIDHYIEPFLGGGAIFFALWRAGRIGRATLNDRNAELICTYRMVRDDPQGLVDRIQQWRYDEETFYAVRAENPTEEMDRAARTLFLNRTCFNGLYRLNSKGQFNVPFGRYAKPRLVDADNLFKASEALQSATLMTGDFEAPLEQAGPGATVYCDPPYWPVSKTANFTSYDQLPFKAAEQERLAAAFARARDRGAHGLLSNSKVDATVELYDRFGFQRRTVMVRRTINRDASKRGPVEELLVSF